MALSIVQKIFGGSYGTSNSLAWPANTTAGNYLIAGYIFVGASGPGTIGGVTGYTLVNNWTNGVVQLYVWDYVNAPQQSGSPSTNTITTTNAVAFGGFLIEITPNATRDGSPAETTGSSSTPAGAAFTSTIANELILGIVAHGNTGINAQATFSAPSTGFAILDQAGGAHGSTSPRAAAQIGVLDQSVSSTGTFTPSCTASFSAPWIGVTIGLSVATTADDLSWYRRPSTFYETIEEEVLYG